MLRGLLFCLCVLGVATVGWAQTAPAPASAAPVAAPANPYAVTVPVAGTSDAQRNDAISAALVQVLAQVSPGFVATPEQLAKAPGFVRDARYQRAASGNGLQLQVDFDPGAVGRLVASAPAATAAVPGSSAPAAIPVGGSATLWISGIDDSHAYASLLALLRGDSALHGVTPIGAEGDGVLVRLSYDQPLTTVLANLGGPAGHLAVDTQPHPGADAALRWQP